MKSLLVFELLVGEEVGNGATTTPHGRDKHVQRGTESPCGQFLKHLWCVKGRSKEGLGTVGA